MDEAVALGFDHIFFTGGEPFILTDIYAMLAYSSARVTDDGLTNAMLLRGCRGGRRAWSAWRIANDNLIVQVSLDGGRAEDHDAYRGKGAWAKTVEGIRLLQAAGFRVRLGTTETPANAAHLAPVVRVSPRRSASPMKTTSCARWRSAATRAKGWSSAWATCSPS